MPANTFTAPLAVIMINNQSVGFIRNLNFTENIQRGDVQGIGEITLQEVPILGVRCSFQADSFTIDTNKLGTVANPFPGAQATNLTELINTMLLGEEPVSIMVYRKTAGQVEASTGIVKTQGKLKKMGAIYDAYLDSKTFTIQEGQVSGQNISGRYLNPMIPG